MYSTERTKQKVAEILAPENFTFTEEEKVEISNDFAKAIKPMIFEIFATNPNRAADLLLNMTDAFVYGTQTMYAAMLEKIKAAVAKVAKIEPPVYVAVAYDGESPVKVFRKPEEYFAYQANRSKNIANILNAEIAEINSLFDDSKEETENNTDNECSCDNCKRRFTYYDGKSPIKVFKTEAEYLEYLANKNK